MKNKHIETATAVLEREDGGLVVCRYKPEVNVDARAVAENLKARLSFPGKEPYAVIGIFPESVNFDMSLIQQDHYTDIALNEVTRILAIVAEGALFEPIARLYFAYYPTRFHSAVFQTEKEARAWVAEKMQALQLVD